MRLSRASQRGRRHAAPRKPRQHGLTEQQPDRERAIEAAGQQQNRPRPDHAERRRRAGRERDAVRFHPAQAGERGDAGIVPAAAGAADRNDCVGVLGLQRVGKLQPVTACRIVERHAARGRDGMHQQDRRRIDDRVAGPGPHHAQAGLANAGCARLARRRARRP